MLMHLRPQFFSFGREVQLVDYRIDRLGLHLKGGVDLATRRPYPNKGYKVGCRRKGQKAIDGLLIETPGHVAEFESVARWAIDAGTLVTHRITYRLIDQDFDTASDHDVLWFAFQSLTERWESRMPSWPRSLIYMDVGDSEDYHGDELVEKRDPDGLLIERSQLLRMPTIERFRIISEINDRMPPLDSAFRISP